MSAIESRSITCPGTVSSCAAASPCGVLSEDCCGESSTWFEACLSDEDDDLVGDKIYLVRFTRCGAMFDVALHHEPPLEEVRAATHMAGKSCRLRCGASIFVRPEDYKAILAVIVESSLRPHHVIAAEQFIPMLWEAVANIPSKHKVKPSTMVQIAQMSQLEEDGVLKVEKTFYNACPRKMLPRSSVTQSTTEQHGGVNPRRAIP